MKQKIFILLMLLSLATIGFGKEKSALAQNMPSAVIAKPTLKVRAVRDVRYWKQPTLDNFWSWMPKVEFAAAGPVADASYFTYEFFTPDGKLWFSQDSKPFAIEEGRYLNLESEAVPRWQDNRSSIATGVFSFKITLKNSLQGTSTTVYQGKFKVAKEFAGTPHPNFKNQYAFYVDQDWTLPTAYIDFDTKNNEGAPIFQTSMWFRGSFTGKLKAYLFFNGKQVANTENGVAVQTDYVITEGDSDNKFCWEKWKFLFYNARHFDKTGNFNTRHLIKNNPGNYELKVLLDGELARTVAFTVGADGNIVDNKIAENNGITGFGFIVPAKVLPTKEGAVNLLAYKTEAFYGNVLNGF